MIADAPFKPLVVIFVYLVDKIVLGYFHYLVAIEFSIYNLQSSIPARPGWVILAVHYVWASHHHPIFLSNTPGRRMIPGASIPDPYTLPSCLAWGLEYGKVDVEFLNITARPGGGRHKSAAFVRHRVGTEIFGVIPMHSLRSVSPAVDTTYSETLGFTNHIL